MKLCRKTFTSSRPTTKLSGEPQVQGSLESAFGAIRRAMGFPETGVVSLESLFTILSLFYQITNTHITSKTEF